MKKDLLVLGFIVLIIAILVSGTKIQSVEDYYLTHIDDITEDSETIFISIRCDTILDNWEKLDPSLKYEKYVPSSGVILETTEYVLRPNDTVFDILARATRYNKIHLDYLGSEATQYGSVYVRGLNHLYEFSVGELSGWMYRVNGEFPNFGASKYYLADGDIIEWIYTCDLGRDVGADWIGDS